MTLAQQARHPRCPSPLHYTCIFSSRANPYNHCAPLPVVLHGRPHAKKPLMTRSNLQTQLTWLLGTPKSAHRPPSIIPSAIASVTLGAEPYSLSQFPSEISNEQFARAPSDVRIDGRLGQGPEAYIPITSARSAPSETMGRLHSGQKSTTKPRLLSQAIPELANTSIGHPSPRPSASLGERYNAAYSQSNHGESW